MPTVTISQVLLPSCSKGFIQGLAISGPFSPRQKSTSAQRRKQPQNRAKYTKRIRTHILPASHVDAAHTCAAHIRSTHVRPASDIYLLQHSDRLSATAQPKTHQLTTPKMQAWKRDGREDVEQSHNQASQRNSQRYDNSNHQSTRGSGNPLPQGYQARAAFTPTNPTMGSHQGNNAMSFQPNPAQNNFIPYSMGSMQPNNAFSPFQPAFFTPSIGAPFNMPFGFFSPSLPGFAQGQAFPVASHQGQHTVTGQFPANTFASSAHHTTAHLQPIGTEPSRATSPIPNRHRVPISAPSAASGGVPTPTDAYLMRASFLPKRSNQPGPLLVVIDLNGTLLHRRKANSSFESRAHAREFIAYCVQTFWVVIWSSATPENVNRMVPQLLAPHINSQVVAVWGRDKFGLSPADYSKRTQCYKRLTRLWEDPRIRGSYPRDRPGFENGAWDQGNTVLIDDSIEKARSEPHNAITLPEYTGGVDIDQDVLPAVHEYLNELCYQEDVSAYIRAHPFRMAEGVDRR